MTHTPPKEENTGPIGPRLGLFCTAILGLSYMIFIALGAFAPSVMARPIQAGGTMTVAMGLGFGIIALGFVLTCIYAAIANAADTDPQNARETEGA